MKVLLIVLLTGLAVESLAQSPANSPAKPSCKQGKVIDHFDFEEFVGKYYQYKIFSALEQLGVFGNCTQQTYTLAKDNDEKLIIKNYQINSNGEVVPSDGFAVRANPQVRNGNITVTINQEGFAVPIVYNILVFRPGKYIIVFSCIFDVRSGWVLTMEKEPCEETRRSIDNDIIEAHKKRGGPSLDEFKETSQKCCPDF